MYCLNDTIRYQQLAALHGHVITYLFDVLPDCILRLLPPVHVTPEVEAFNLQLLHEDGVIGQWSCKTSKIGEM